MLSLGFHAAQRPWVCSYDVASRTGPSTGEPAPKVASLYAVENEGTKWPALAWNVRPTGHQGASTEDRAVVWILLVVSLQRRLIGARPIECSPQMRRSQCSSGEVARPQATSFVWQRLFRKRMNHGDNSGKTKQQAG